MGRENVTRRQALPQLIMASATLSSGVKSLLDDVRGFRLDMPGVLQFSWHSCDWTIHIMSRRTLSDCTTWLIQYMLCCNMVFISNRTFGSH